MSTPVTVDDPTAIGEPQDRGLAIGLLVGGLIGFVASTVLLIERFRLAEREVPHDQQPRRVGQCVEQGGLRRQPGRRRSHRHPTMLGHPGTSLPEAVA